MWNSHASMSSLNLGETENAESPNKETGSGISGRRNILFAINFQTKVCYWWVTFIPSSSHFSKLLSRVIPTTKPQVNLQLLPCSVWRFHFFWSLWGSGLATVHMFFSTQQKLVSTLFSTVMVKGKVEANLALSIVETPARCEVPHRGGWEGLHKTVSNPGWLWQFGQHSDQPCGYHWCGNCKGHTSRQMGICPVIRWLTFLASSRDWEKERPQTNTPRYTAFDRAEILPGKPSAISSCMLEAKCLHLYWRTL